MLCTSCQNKPHCVAAKLAEGDAALDRLLGQLQRCGLYRRSSLRQRLRAFWRSLGDRLALIFKP